MVRKCLPSRRKKVGKFGIPEINVFSSKQTKKGNFYFSTKGKIENCSKKKDRFLKKLKTVNEQISLVLIFLRNKN